MFRNSLIFAVLSCLCACQHSTHAPVSVQAAPLAQLDNLFLTTADLNEKSQQRLQALQDEYAQKQYMALWSGIEDTISDKLLASEAKTRHLSIEALLQIEVDAHVGQASEAEIQGLYRAHQDVIGVAYEEAAPFLREQYQNDRKQSLRRAFIDTLRQKHHVAFVAKPPVLQRIQAHPQGPSSGPKHAPITLIVFSDFQCPYSAQARRLVKRLQELYGDKLQVVHQDFPLEQHPLAFEAARAGVCAEAQQQFWPFYEMLFDNSSQLNADTFHLLARKLGLDMRAFTSCMQSSASLQKVKSSQDLGQQLGVRATPTFIVNGMRLSGILPQPLIQAYIDQEPQS